MSKGTKNLILATLIIAAIGFVGYYGYNNGWFGASKTETAISNPVKPDTQLAAEKAAREKAEADLKAKEKQLAEMQEKFNQMKQDDAAQTPPANQIATPVPANPADSTTTVTPVQKKKSGVGG